MGISVMDSFEKGNGGYYGGVQQGFNGCHYPHN